jgi:hypothetical protein
MELREHPLMRYRGIPNWPPIWTQARKTVSRTIRGEVGVLEYVHHVDGDSAKIYLVIKHENQSFVGTLLFSHHGFCHQIARLLRAHIGRSIKEIGDLDVSGNTVSLIM